MRSLLFTIVQSLLLWQNSQEQFRLGKAQNSQQAEMTANTFFFKLLRRCSYIEMQIILLLLLLCGTQDC